MSGMTDPIQHMATEATQKMLNGVEINEREYQAVLFHWTVTRIESSNQELVEAMSGNGGRRNFVKKQGPAAGAGFGVASVLAFLRDVVMGSG